MFNGLRRVAKNFVAMSMHQKLDIMSEGTWLLIIFLLPVYFNTECFYAFYLVKALALVFLVCLLLGLVLARWFLTPAPSKVGDLPAKIRKSPLQFTALVLGLMWMVSTVFSVMPATSLWGNLSECAGFLPNLAWIIFFLVISQKARDRSQVFRALYALMFSSGIVALLGILQFISPDVFIGSLMGGRVYSTDGNPLSLSGFVAMAMPITLALMILNWYGWGSQPRSKNKFVAMLILFGLQLCCLAFAQYSITLLLFIVGIFVFFALIGIFLQRKTALALSILTILLVAVVAAVFIGQIMLSDKTVRPVETQSTDIPVAEKAGLSTLSIRIEYWKCAVDVMIDSPEIPFNNDDLHGMRRFIGYGPDTFMATSQLKFPASLKSGHMFDLKMISQPENHFLYFAVTLGILGLLAFLALLAVFFFLGFKLLSRSNNREAIVLSAAFLAAIVQYCAYISFNPSRITADLIFWLILGLTVALVKVDSAGMSVECPTQSVPNCTPGGTPKANKMRKSFSVLIVIIFIAAGIGLSQPLLMGNMKVRDGYRLWNKDRDLALTSFTAATLIGPDQAIYHEILGQAAFSMAAQAKNSLGEKNTLLSLVELAGNTAIRIEPQLAIWRYRLADREMYRIMDGSAEEKANILYLYQEADQLFPGNAVILDKWALALMLMRDYEKAEQKIAEAGKADPLWSQNSFYGGLLKSLQGRSDEAGGMFVLPEKGQSRLTRTLLNGLNDIDYFMNFCAQAAKYGAIGNVADDLKYYAADKGDWMAWTFLGIADVFAGRAGEAMEAFSKSAELIPDEEIPELKGVVMVLSWNTPALQSAAIDLVESLVDRQVK